MGQETRDTAVRRARALLAVTLDPHASPGEANAARLKLSNFLKEYGITLDELQASRDPAAPPARRTPWKGLAVGVAAGVALLAGFAYWQLDADKSATGSAEGSTVSAAIRVDEPAVPRAAGPAAEGPVAYPGERAEWPGSIESADVRVDEPAPPRAAGSATTEPVAYPGERAEWPGPIESVATAPRGDRAPFAMQTPPSIGPNAAIAERAIEPLVSTIAVAASPIAAPTALPAPEETVAPAPDRSLDRLDLRAAAIEALRPPTANSVFGDVTLVILHDADASEQARALADRLTAAGAARIERRLVAFGVAESQIRYFASEDAEVARRFADLVSEDGAIPTRDFSSLVSTAPFSIVDSDDPRRIVELRLGPTP